MAYTTIDKPSDYFETKLYTGTGSSHAITGVGFSPNWVWIKHRNEANPHKIFDTVRGVGKSLKSNSTDIEASNEENGYVSAFGSDGFTLVGGSTSSNDVNKSSGSYVAWNWKAGGSGSTNTDGSVNSTVSANATAGFSIVEYNTAGSGTQTVGHGLGSAPTFIITKPAQNTESWYVYIPTGVSSSLRLNTTAAAISSTPYAGTPTSSVFSINNGIIGGYSDVISYCFTDVKGYSKFGSYKGTGNVNGTFVYTGQKSRFIIIKRSSASGSWYMYDTKRDTHNVMNKELGANIANAENDLDGGDDIDFLSNGFKLRDASSNNDGNSTYIYMAFAENPFVTSSAIPTTAR